MKNTIQTLKTKQEGRKNPETIALIEALDERLTAVEKAVQAVEKPKTTPKKTTAKKKK